MHRATSEVSERPARIILAALLLAALATQQGYAQELLYREDFENFSNERGLWTMSRRSTVYGGKLLVMGTGGMASYRGRPWGNVRIDFRLYGRDGVFGFCDSDSGNYAIDFSGGDIPDGPIQLFKTRGGDKRLLKTSDSRYDSLEQYEITAITAESGRIQVMINGALLLEYTDFDPLPPGGIYFASNPDARIEIDDIRVRALPRSTAAAEKPDLVVRYSSSSFDSRRRILTLLFQVSNVGNAPSDKTAILVMDTAQRIANVNAPVPELERGQTELAQAPLRVPDDQRGTKHVFMAEVDPEALIEEMNEDNNTSRTQSIYIPNEEPRKPVDKPPPVPPPRKIPWTPVIIATITLVGVTLGIRKAVRASHRKKWQERSEEEEPPETCQPCARYCRRVEIEVDPARRKIANVTISFHDSVSGGQYKDIYAKGKAVSDLNKLLKFHRQRKRQKKLQKQAKSVAGTLSRQIMDRLQHDPQGNDVSMVAHLEGGEATCKFILYHCKRRGNTGVWEEESEWEATIKDERDEVIGALRYLDPADAGILARLTPELIQLLIQFVQRI